MPTRDDYNAAVAEGIIDARQAERLVSFFTARATDDPWNISDDKVVETEDVRFVRGFHDIFIAVGVALLFAGLTIAGQVTETVTASLAVAAAIAWALAEFLARRRRLVLPSIVLCIAFILCAGGTVWSALGLEEYYKEFHGVAKSGGTGFIMTSLTGLAAALIFFARFRLPFALGVSAACGITLAFSTLLYIDRSFVDGHITAILLIAGLCVFAAAMAFDLSDRKRRTLRADNAFWLHLLAAPLMVHSILTFVSFGKDSNNEVAGAAAVIGVVMMLALVALFIDRRAMLVVGLGYLGAAIAVVISELSVTGTTVAAITLIILGAGVVALGSGWQASRSVLFRILPLSGALRKKLPPVRGQS